MDRKAGYLLLLCGLLVLAGSAVSLWRVFHGGMNPPQAFTADTTIELTLPTGMNVNVPLPPQVNKFANLALSFMLAFFLAVVGGKIGDLGVGLINGPPAAPAPKKTDPAG